MNKILNILVMFMFAIPIVFAQDNITETTVQVGKEYSTIDQFVDRVKLAFTFQEERKVELMNRIEQKREQHYSFLIANGKTEQAERFKVKTIGLEKNFEQWKEKKANILTKMEATKTIEQNQGDEIRIQQKVGTVSENSTEKSRKSG